MFPGHRNRRIHSVRHELAAQQFRPTSLKKGATDWGQPMHVRGRRVLAAPVGVEDEAGSGLTAEDCHLHRLFDQTATHVVRDGEAHDSAAAQVDDRGQVGPALPGAQIGDVSDPRAAPGSLCEAGPAPRALPRSGPRARPGRLLPGRPSGEPPSRSGPSPARPGQRSCRWTGRARRHLL